MKNVFSLFVLLFLYSGIHAQEWETDMHKAKEMAQTHNRPIILVFQGSDWCIPCMKLDKEIWSTPTFQDYAKEHYVMLQADFPRKKQNKLSEEREKANAQLAEKYNTQGIFPLVAVLSSDGGLLGKAGYKRISPEDYIEWLNSFLK